MSKVDDGGPAFPQHQEEFVDHPVHGRIHRNHVDMALEPGMTLRDWFAGQALTGDFASQSEEMGMWSNDTAQSFMEARARLYYRMADALLTARRGGGDSSAPSKRRVTIAPASDIDHASTSPGPLNCRTRAQFQGEALASDRCERCGVGPCPFFDETGKAREDV